MAPLAAAHSPKRGDQTEKLQRAQFAYDIPDVDLVREDGAAVNLKTYLAACDRPVLLNFLFTSCSAVCPISAMVFSQLQALMQDHGKSVEMVSVTIDPLQDTPEKLAEYARTFEAGPNWHFLTGTLEACLTVQRAFDADRGDKMNHPTVTLIRTNLRGSWTRLDGLATADDILDELHRAS